MWESEGRKALVDESGVYDYVDFRKGSSGWVYVVDSDPNQLYIGPFKSFNEAYNDAAWYNGGLPVEDLEMPLVEKAK